MEQAHDDETKKPEPGAQRVKPHKMAALKKFVSSKTIDVVKFGKGRKNNKHRAHAASVARKHVPVTKRKRQRKRGKAGRRRMSYAVKMSQQSIRNLNLGAGLAAAKQNAAARHKQKQAAKAAKARIRTDSLSLNREAGQGEKRSTWTKYDYAQAGVGSTGAQGGADEWEPHVDKKTGHTFYHNKRLRRTTWTKPPKALVESAKLDADARDEDTRQYEASKSKLAKIRDKLAGSMKNLLHEPSQPKPAFPAKFPYTKRKGSSEVSMAAGDEIEVIKTHSSAGWQGWSTVLNRTTGEQGIVPTSYVC